MIPRNITVALDGSSFAERAIPVAKAAAAQLGASVQFLVARSDDDPDAARAYLTRTAREHDVSEARFVADRDAAEALVEVAEDPAGIVCMTSHGRGKLRWSALGSVAEDVVRNSNRPVLLVGRHCEPPRSGRYESAIVCLEGSSGTDPVEPLAIEWAKSLHLVVHAVQVIHPLDVEWTEHPNEEVVASVARMQTEGLEAGYVVLRSRLPAYAIADHVEAVADPIVMMSSHSRTGVARVALGSVTMGVVSMATAPVLVTGPA
jgi:nucleotide-binding universal stress UspA family protein